MKQWRDNTSRFGIRLSFSALEIDDLCEEALFGQALLPTEPKPVRIDRFVEKQFNLSITYLDLGENYLGCTEFNQTGKVTRLIVSSRLAEDNKLSSLRRERSTIAHEAGHGLLHSTLFLTDDETLLAIKQHLQADQSQKEPSKILCRDADISGVQTNEKTYDGKWWEWQANRAIGGLLLPRKLVRAGVQQFITASKGELPELHPEKRPQAIDYVATTFDVNPIVAKIRLSELFPSSVPNSLF